MFQIMMNDFYFKLEFYINSTFKNFLFVNQHNTNQSLLTPSETYR